MSTRDKIAELRKVADDLGHPMNGVCDPHTVARALVLIADTLVLLDYTIPPEQLSDPLPRCSHGSALRDGAGEALEPPCGCRSVSGVTIVPFVDPR